MPFLPEHPRFKGIALPPSGWVLGILLVVYIFIGLIGHDPWKHDDAITIGIAYDIFAHGNWLTPNLAGQPYPDAPLYYWTAASFVHLFSWLLPIHDAARLASGLFTLLALEFILLAARERHGRDHAAAAPLILAGSLGFLFHAHEAQPMLAALTAHTAAYWAVTLMPRRPYYSTVVLGGAIALGFLANGLLPVILLAPVTIFTLCQSDNKKQTSVLLGFSLVLALVLVSLWLIPLLIRSPNYLSAFLQNELNPLTRAIQPPSNIVRYLNMLLWYAWPALPLAAWTLWSKRRILGTKQLALPALSFLLLLVILGLIAEVRSSVALLLLPPLVLLAVPAVGTLRRGAANAFDWFGMMTFTIFAAVAWLVWSAMVFGWPERLARQVVRLEPGFVGQFNLVASLFALLATIIWIWLAVTSPRSPMRGIMHWMAGLTLFWVLIAVLWMPWIDYGKSYRPLSASLAKTLPAKTDCIANANLADSILASLDYFEGIRTVPLKNEAAQRCSWLLLHGQVQDSAALSSASWRQVWEGWRPGDRKDVDIFHLYRRGNKTRTATSLPEFTVEAPEAIGARP